MLEKNRHHLEHQSSFPLQFQDVLAVLYPDYHHFHEAHAGLYEARLIYLDLNKFFGRIYKHISHDLFRALWICLGYVNRKRTDITVFCSF